MMRRFGGFYNRIFPLTLLLFLDMTVESFAMGEKGLHFEYIHPASKMLRLRCQANVPPSYGHVFSISIYNVTSHSKLAWVIDRQRPVVAEQHEAKKNIYLAGSLSRTHHKMPSLSIIILHFDSSTDQTFGCNVTIMNLAAKVEYQHWNVTVNKTVSQSETSSAPPSTTTTTTGAPYRIGAVKKRGESKAFIESDGLPMTVLIIMLVIVSILLFLAVFLLMHRYRSRCQRRDEEDMYRPPAYCLAPDHSHPHHHLEWTDNSSSLKSKGSARTLNSRGQYSFAAHQNMPLPPIPHMTPRRNKTYRRPPSVNSNVRVQYIQPQDAIGQESSEDGEIAALSSGSPNVHYKTSRDRQCRMNSPLYACVPVSSTDE